MTLKEFLENYYYGKHVRIYIDGRVRVAGTTRQVLEYIKREQLDNPLQFDSAKGYASGIATAIEIVKGGGLDEK